MSACAIELISAVQPSFFWSEHYTVLQLGADLPPGNDGPVQNVVYVLFLQVQDILAESCAVSSFFMSDVEKMAVISLLEGLFSATSVKFCFPLVIFAW